MSKALSMWYLTDISVFCDQAPSSSQKHTQICLKEMRFVSSISAFPAHVPVWPNTWQLCRHGATAVCRHGATADCTQGWWWEGAQGVWGHVVTPQRWDTAPNPPSSHPWDREPPCPSCQPACQLSAGLVFSLLRNLFHLLGEKLGFSGLRRDRETQPEGRGLWSLTAYAIIHKISLWIHLSLLRGNAGLQNLHFFLSPVKTKHDYRSFYCKVRLTQL